MAAQSAWCSIWSENDYPLNLHPRVIPNKILPCVGLKDCSRFIADEDAAAVSDPVVNMQTKSEHSNSYSEL